MVTSPDTGFDIAIEFDCENVAEPEEFLETISLLKRHVIGGPIRKALLTLVNGTSESLQPCSVSYRKGEVLYVTPSDSKIFVSFFLDFADNTDKAMARVFLQVNFMVQCDGVVWWYSVSTRGIVCDSWRVFM